jgi:phosphatidylglycerophosphate synthase
LAGKTDYSSLQDRRHVARPLFIINASHPGAWEDVGGLPLTIRNLFHLKAFGLREGTLFADGARDLTRFKKWLGNLQLRQEILRENIWTAMRPFSDRAGNVVYVDAAHLVDPRILEHLCTARDTVIAFMEPAEAKSAAVRAGFLKKEDFRRLCVEGPADVVRSADALHPEEIDPFSPRVRGCLTPYFMEVRSKEQAKRATRVLIASQQKQVMDLPAEFIDPLFEDLLTRLLCNTPITPNIVTLFGVATATVAALLYLHGLYLAGALCTFVLEILDGVDGKLAHTKLYFTRIGEHEDLIDYLCETGLYAALGAGLSHGGIGPALSAGLLILSDTADNIFYTLGQKFFGKSIDLFSPFDGWFRRIAGRRNIYTFMFIIGFSIGFPVYTFGAASVWAALTAAIHGFRLSQYRRRSRTAIEVPAEELR